MRDFNFSTAHLCKMISFAIVILFLQTHALAWNTFMGSTEGEVSGRIAVDSSGYVYVTGASEKTWGNPKNPHSGDCDIFVAKLKSDGEMVWNTFIGSSAEDFGDDIAVDSSGNIYVSGSSKAAWGNPVRAYSGKQDVFAAKLTGEGVLLWNTFLGGSSTDGLNGYIALDSSGNVYVTGTSWETWGEPVMQFHEESDVFAAKLDAQGKLIWNTFMGCGIDDISRSIVADSTYVYIAGDTHDKTWLGSNPVDNFSGFGGYGGGHFDGFVVKLRSDTGSREWYTFMGGKGGDSSYGIAVDTSGNIYVTGDSSLTWGSPINPYNSPNYDVYVLKLNSKGERQWNTFMGKADKLDVGPSIALDSSGSPYIIGSSYAVWGEPISNGGANELERKLFIAKLNPQGQRQWHTFTGARNPPWGSIAVDASEKIYVSGSTQDTYDAPINPYTPSDYDVFVEKLSFLTCDMDGNESTDLGDSILLLKILAGIQTGFNMQAADSNKDGKFGLEDVIYVLQIVAGLR